MGSVRASVAGNVVELWVLDEITSFTAQELLVAFDANPSAHFIINIFSHGGNPFAANALHDRMKQKGVKATARIFGHAASAAAMIACACERVEIGENSFLMIHDAYGSDNAELIASINEIQINLFKRKTGLSASKIEAMMKAETWMDAKAAKANGFADSIIKEMAIAALYKAQYMEETTKPAEAETPETPEVVPPVVEATEEVEQEIPVTVPQAIEAAVKGKIIAKVKVSTEMKTALAAAISEAKDTQAKLQERIDEVTALNEKLTAAEARATEAEAKVSAATTEACDLRGKITEITAEVDKLKKAPLASAEGEPKGGVTTPGAGPSTTTPQAGSRDAKAERVAAVVEATINKYTKRSTNAAQKA